MKVTQIRNLGAGIENLSNGTSHSGPVRIEGTGTFSEPGALWDTVIGFELR
ncbi:MAG: hypothetical protein MUF04_14530 [Akkermansiaceae bacterium]|nr:hypothetical protein [Akkermansiaceae bacterium]